MCLILNLLECIQSLLSNMFLESLSQLIQTSLHSLTQHVHTTKILNYINIDYYSKEHCILIYQHFSDNSKSFDKEIPYLISVIFQERAEFILKEFELLRNENL